jgi:membrane-associated phospholipid phosphatase
MTLRAAATSRIELRLGVAFWTVLAATALFAGAAGTLLPFLVPVVIGVAVLWRLRARPWVRPLLDWLPLPFVVYTYETLAHVVPACWDATIDAGLRAVDRAVLGADVGTLLEPLVSESLTRVLSVAYGSYYLLPISLALWFSFRSRVAFRELVAGEVGALFIGYLGYLFLPAVGPYVHHAEVFDGPLVGDFMGDAIRALNAQRAGGPPRDVFPSVHTANAVTVLLVAARHERRAVFVYALPCLALIAATVYLRFHYAVDVAAGALLAVAWQAVVPRLVASEGMRPGPVGHLQSGVPPDPTQGDPTDPARTEESR